MVRRERDRSPIAGDRGGQLIELKQRIGAVVVRIGPVGRERDGPVVALDRAGAAAELGQGVAEIVVERGSLRRERRCLGKEPYRLVVVPGLGGDDTEQVQGPHLLLVQFESAPI